ncbi:hypothetical protein [Lysinibacillus sp. 54212]|uniref:hypothetical protein n=1 Tax=Lysinibacillus sp. 54212 TaxID=3119829 RepID=UPI002FCC5DE5
MILAIQKQEAAAMSLHMSIMRKSIRNMLKKRYSMQKKEWLSSFDYLVTSVRDFLEIGQEFGQLNLNIRDVEMLQEFIRAYQQQIELNKQLQKQLTAADKEQLELLTAVQIRCKELMKNDS